MKTLLSFLAVSLLFVSALFFNACDKNCPLPDSCDCSEPTVDQHVPTVYLAYLNSFSRVLYAVPGYEVPFLKAFHAKEIGSEGFYLPPTEDFPEGMNFTLLLSDVETVSQIAAAEEAKLMTVIRDEPNLVFFAGTTFEGYECGEHIDIGTAVVACKDYEEAGKEFSKKSVATENYTKCKPAGRESSCIASRKEVGKVQHYEGKGCDKDKPLAGISEKFYDWVCQ